MFRWFRRPPAPTAREARWQVALRGDELSVTDQDGGVRAMRLTDLSGVMIETNDSGPGGADVWWLLFGADDRVVCAYPQGATGEQALLDALMALPGFDHGQMIEAMTCAEKALFPVWRRQA